MINKQCKTTIICDCCGSEISDKERVGNIKFTLPKRFVGWYFVPKTTANWTEVCVDCSRKIEVFLYNLKERNDR